MPVPGVPTTQMFRLRSVFRSNPGLETGIPMFLVRGMFSEGSSRFMNSLPSSTVPQREEPCSSPRLNVPPLSARWAQIPQIAQAARMPASGASAFARSMPPPAIQPGSCTRASKGSREPSGRARRLPTKAKPARAAQAERRATLTTVCLAKGVNGPSLARLPRGSCRVRVLRVPRIS